MLFNKRGQISAEIIVAIAVILLLFIVVLANNFAMEDTSKLVATSLNDKKECVSFAFLISQVYSSGVGSSASFQLRNNATVYSSQKSITINQESCFFLAPTSNYSLSKGKILLSNVDGNIVMVSE
jgi:uncharacterized protein (UPF0333 family)